MQAYLECIQPISPDSKKFAYQGFDAALIMQIIEVVVPGSAEDFIQKEVLGKLGITEYLWEREKSDLPRSSGATWFRSRDMLKIGMVFASHGKWNGKQLFSQEFMQKATSPLVKAYGPYRFGYFNWQRTIGKGDDNYMNIQLRGGKSGQLINIFPKQELIIVTTSHGNYR